MIISLPYTHFILIGVTGNANTLLQTACDIARKQTLAATWSSPQPPRPSLLRWDRHGKSRAASTQAREDFFWCLLMSPPWIITLSLGWTRVFHSFISIKQYLGTLYFHHDLRLPSQKNKKIKIYKSIKTWLDHAESLCIKSIATLPDTVLNCQNTWPFSLCIANSSYLLYQTATQLFELFLLWWSTAPFAQCKHQVDFLKKKTNERSLIHLFILTQQCKSLIPITFEH